MKSRIELEREWYARVKAARLRYVESKVQAPGSAETERQAPQSENSALEEYERTFRIYTDLVLYGKVPEESES